MPQHKTRAFILGIADYRETSKLLHILCEDQGRMSLVARGLGRAKSKKPPPEPFHLMQVTYQVKDSATIGNLNSLDTERVYGSLHGDLDRYALASYWFEIAGAIAQPGLACPELFRATVSLMETLEFSGALSAGVPGHFGQLLESGGAAGELSACANCGRHQGLVHLDLESASLLCSNCAGPRGNLYPLKESTGLDIAHLLGTTQPDKAAPPLTRSRLLAILEATNKLVEYHFDVQPKSFAFLRQTLDGINRGKG